MLKYLAKFASDILPSVAATIIGAYIVNHYINAKPAAPAPAAVSSTTADSKPADADVANIPAAAVKAKGISDKGASDKAASDKATSDKAVADKGSSEKAAFDKAAADKPQDKAKEKTAEKAPEKAQDKSEDKPADTASISTDIHRHPVLPREKAAIRTIPLTAQPAASASVPANPPPVVEATVKPDEQRDANDLARAAIERLRESSSHSQDAARAAAPQAPTSVQPLPPPVMVAAPAGDTFAPDSNGQMQQTYPSVAQGNDPNRPVPPADIPQPLEVRTDNNGVPSLPQHNKNVAEDMLSAAKSVFHAVLPQ